MKKIGLVGGIGPSSTVDYYLRYISKVRSYYGENVYPEIVIDSVSLQKATEYYERGDLDGSARLMIDSVSNLQRAGAEVAAITANTEHIVWDKMKDHFTIPVVSIVDAVTEDVKRRGYKNVLILGTAYTMRSRLYGKGLEDIGVSPIFPSDRDIAKMGDLIYPNLENGIVVPKDREQFLSITGKYVDKSRVEAILLGCTELSLMIKEGDIEVPIIDSVEAHINAIFESAR